jgi:hypothetical protein
VDEISIGTLGVFPVLGENVPIFNSFVIKSLSVVCFL